MGIAKGDFSLKCSKCDEQHDFDVNDVDFESVSSNEREQGYEIGYSWEENLACECGNDIEIDYHVWEYPEGFLNHEEVNIIGGTVLKKFDFEFLVDDNFDESDEDDE